jgi:phage terminase large subunit
VLIAWPLQAPFVADARLPSAESLVSISTIGACAVSTKNGTIPRRQLQSWLKTEPSDRHAWAREQLAAGKLVLDEGRSYQAEALDTLAQPGRYCLLWCNGAAKTTTAALALHWFLDNYPGGKALTTAATYSQMREQLWREIGTWAARAKAPIVANEVGVDKTQIDIGPDWAAFGRAFDREGSFEGVHAPFVMVIVDEARAVEPAVFEECERILRGSTDAKFWWIVLSTPGSPSGPLHDIVHGNLAHRWQTLRLSAYESERIDLEQIAKDAEDLGESSPLFQSMVLAQFPDAAEDTIIPLSWVEAAVERDVSKTDGSAVGVDISRFGSDETTFMRVSGRRASMIASYSGKDLMETTGRVRRLADEVDKIAVDDAGLGGGVTDRCRELGVRNLVPINPGSKARKSEEFADSGTEMLWELRKAFEETIQNPLDPTVGISIPRDKKLIHQLSARRYDFKSDGRIKAESKSDMRKRGERSPDRADALAMAWWIRGGRRQQIDFKKVMDINLKDAVYRGPAAELFHTEW